MLLLFVSWKERVSDDHMSTSVDVPQEAYTDVVKSLSVIHPVSFARVSPPLSDHAIVSPPNRPHYLQTDSEKSASVP
jgi:hypothetical protein